MDGWDISIMLVAGFFAVTMLARMMGQHGDALLAKLRHDFELEQQRLAAERRKQKQIERKQRQLERKQKYLEELEERDRRARAA
jgi:predicted Holliday junction resolvase-like endonuclease